MWITNFLYLTSPQPAVWNRIRRRTFWPHEYFPMVTIIANFAILKIELPIISVGFSAGALLSERNLLETLTGWCWTVGFSFPLCLLQTDRQSPWGLSCSGATAGQLVSMCGVEALNRPVLFWKIKYNHCVNCADMIILLLKLKATSQFPSVWRKKLTNNCSL